MAVRPRRSLVPHFRLCLPRPPSPHTCRGMKKNALVILCITAYYWHLVGCDDDEAEKVTLSRYQIHGAAGLAWERTKALEKSGQPGVVITEPSMGAAAISKCQMGNGLVRVYIAIHQGNFPDGVIQDLSDEAGVAFVVLNGVLLTNFTIYRRCVKDRPGALLPERCKDPSTPPTGVFLLSQHVVVISDLSCDRDHSVVVTAELEVYRNEQGSPSGSPLEIKAFACESEFRLVDTASLLRPHPRPDLPLDDFPPDVHFETHAEITSDKRLLEGAITRSDFFGFRKDFEVLHVILRRYAESRKGSSSGVATFLEIGTNDGYGLVIIDAALRGPREHRSRRATQDNAENGWRLLTLDLAQCSHSDLDSASKSVCVKGDFSKRSQDVGKLAKDDGVQYQQLWGDSMLYDFTQHGPIEVWWIDGAHDYAHVFAETEQAVRAGGKLIAYHDTHIAGVLSGARDALSPVHTGGKVYSLHHVLDTRVLYALLQTPPG